MGLTHSFQIIYSQSLRLMARVVTRLLGRGAGKLAPWLPKGQIYQVQDYCGEFKFNIDTTYPMESTVWLSGVYDRTTTEFLKTVLRPDDVFLDIGANCGALTLVAASRIQTGHIYAFEPAPVISLRLQQNIQSNPGLSDRVTVVPLGIGPTRGELFYQEDLNFRGNGSLFNQGDTRVEVWTLDEWIHVHDIPKVNVIKVDVEGMEYGIFLGSKALLNRDHPLIYFETMPNNLTGKSHTITDIYQYLSELGYRIVNPSQPSKAVDWQHPPNDSVAIYG